MQPLVTRLAVTAGLAWSVAIVLATPAPQAVARTQAPAPAAGGALHHVPGTLFSHSDDCVACHNNLVSPSGEDVSIGAAWRASMMANSARDPYWQASVRREAIDHPSHADAIEDECAACHMPMAQKTARATGGRGRVFAHLPAGGEDPMDRLAADGVSCTVCHQIAGETLGTRASFNGNFALRPSRPDGTRDIFGPFAVDAGRRAIMRSATGFEQVEAPHVRQSELCATCHTLITEAYDAGGRAVGSLHEQMNFQEWRHSAFHQEQRSCQSCHMPAVPGPVRSSSVLGDPRPSLARHVFLGGNAFMLRMLNRYRIELGVEALPAELEAAARATVRQLETETATIAVSSRGIRDGRLAFDVDVVNLTGHKFPTGYPSRRAWLHVIVRDAGGRVVFESGAVTEAGLIRGNDSDANPLTFEPLYDSITRPDEVQVYEPILGDPAGRPTTGLLTATQYLKDNRLLPRGFDKQTADASIGVFGGASSDASFTGGGDRVRYDVAVPAGGGPFEVAVTLYYQSIAYRWAQNLSGYDAPEPRRFVGYYTSMAATSAVAVARASARGQ